MTAEDPLSVILADDPWLTPHRGAIDYRNELYHRTLDLINKHEGGADKFTSAYKTRGLNVDQSTGVITYREWAPGASEASLIGNFNSWDRSANPMKRNEFGVWEISINPKSGKTPAIEHNSKIKVSFHLPNGEWVDRLPAMARRAVQDTTIAYDAVFWNPPVKYVRKNKSPPKPTEPIIYEAHVGISSPEGKVASYPEFTKNILPRIKALGYNTIQLMAVMEHPYYASFGYQVTNFYAPSSRFGTPEELMELIDVAHGLGITVLLDVVHSHASKNVLDGINEFDGTDHCYFHEGGRGRHELWDSRLFNYGHVEVLRFLLSNLRYWVDEFGFDGFRFDGVTSMLYFHHGMGTGFAGGYNDYFGPSVDNEAIVYLMLANSLIRQLHPHITVIAEDVSGMPTLCRPVSEGGIGFDYRLAMAIPDMWIKLLKEFKDEDWSLSHIIHTLTNRRWKEPVIAYCESHDQALVGDKTIAFWLMDKEMYDFMSTMSPLTPIIDRGLSLHKMIRLITSSLGGEGYLNFEGNEFGHPEWLDFPREGNGSSYHYARRQFNLPDDELLRYKFLNSFDAQMNKTAIKYHWFKATHQYVSLKHESDKVVVYEKGSLLFVFNFHHSNSYTDYRIGAEFAGVYKIVLDTDSKDFGGHGRVDPNCEYHTTDFGWNGRKNFIQVYIPSRTALVLAKQE